MGGGKSAGAADWRVVGRWGAWLPPFELRPWASPRPCASLVSLHEGRAVGDHPYASVSSAPLKSACKVAAVSPSRHPESLPLGDSQFQAAHESLSYMQKDGLISVSDFMEKSPNRSIGFS